MRADAIAPSPRDGAQIPGSAYHQRTNRQRRIGVPQQSVERN